jgi:hypothetical protein
MTRAMWLGLAGCSFAIAKGPDARSAKGEVTCSDGYGMPILDIAIAIPIGVFAASAFANAAKPQEPDTMNSSSFAKEGIVATLIGLPFLVSAIYGFQTIDPDGCKAARAGSAAPS